jgi:UDP-glucose 4-epimerase
MRVLITGVAGFIGSNLLDYLLANTDWQITGVDNLSTGNRNNIEKQIGKNRFAFMEKDCTQIESLKQFDKVFHLAALPRIQPSFEFINEHIQANLVSAVHLLEVMIRENHFPRIVYSGSSAIYGTPKTIPTAEDEPIDCLSPYAFQKYEFEKYMELIATRYPLEYVILRYFNPYGPRSFNPANKFNAYSSVVGIFLNKYKNGEELLVTGDGQQKRDFIHVYDLASANHKAAIHEGKLNTAFNIGNGSTLSILELAKMISPKYKFIPKREGEADITFANIAKARQILKWEPTYKLNDYLQSVIEAK